MLELHSRARKITQEKINKFALLETFAAHTAICGAVRTEWHQSIPSSSIENSAAVSDTVPLVTCGQIESPALETFREKTWPVAIEPQHLDQIAASSTYPPSRV